MKPRSRFSRKWMVVIGIACLVVVLVLSIAPW